MSFLLGSEYCIQSLSNDVNDIQSCIKDILFKIGRINSISWKFPDKFACDLNIDEYLINYKYDSSDIESNQMSHIILLELIIDRFCLLLQLHCETVEKLISKEISSTTASKKDSTSNKMISPCLGLTSKKHWNKLSQLSIYIDNLHKEIAQFKKTNNNLMSELETMKTSKFHQNTIDESLSTENVSKQASDWLKSLENENKAQLKNRKSITGNISKDMTFKSSQTIDTAFKPCESCHISQTCLRESSSLLMKILKDESQPSSLLKLQQEILTVDWLSDKKILQIKDSFAKDLDKICKIYSNIRQKEMKTSADLLNKENLCKQLTENLSKQKNDLSDMEMKFLKEKENFEFQTQNLNSTINQHQTQIISLREELQSNCTELDKEKKNVKQQTTEKQKIIDQFETLRMSIFNFNVNSTDPHEALNIINRTITEQNDIISQMNSTIQSQKSINENLTVTENVIKDKEEKLVKRLQNLTQHKHKLEDKIDILQDQLESNQECLRAIEEEKNSMTMKLSNQTILIETITKAKDEFNLRIIDLQDQVNNMQKTIVELKEEKTLLLNYPDLNGPVDKIESGNIEQDIQYQIKSNISRIKLLSEQNLDLEQAINKLNQSSLIINKSLMTNNNSSMNDNISNSGGLPPKYVLNLDVSRPNSKMSHVTQSKKLTQRHSASSRPRSRENVSSQNPIIQWSVSNQKSSNSNNPVACETCGRQYQQKSDLDVHKEYCAGRRRRSEQK